LLQNTIGTGKAFRLDSFLSVQTYMYDERGVSFYCFWKLFTGCMIKCQSLGGSSQWAAVQTVVDITTITLFSWLRQDCPCRPTSMFQDAHPLPRPYFTDYSNCRRRSIDPRTSSIGGPNELSLVPCWHKTVSRVLCEGRGC
jgi:hypothetical protein